MKKIMVTVVSMLVLCLCLSGCGDKNKTGAMTGDIIDVSAALIEISTQDGETYQYSLSDIDKSAIAGGESLAKGDNVTIHYNGETDDDNLMQKVDVTEVKLNKKADTANNQNQNSTNKTDANTGNTNTGNTGGAKGENAIEGEIVDATMQTIVIKATDGNTYSFNKDTATINMGDDGLVVGEDVIITYNGILNPEEESIAISINED